MDDGVVCNVDDDDDDVKKMMRKPTIWLLCHSVLFSRALDALICLHLFSHMTVLID